MTYSNNGKLCIWVKSISGSPIEMVFPDARFSIGAQWKIIEVTEKQFGWIKRQNRLVKVSEINPNQTQTETTIALQSISTSPEEISIVVGDNTAYKVVPNPDNADISKFKLEVYPDNPQICSVGINGNLVSVKALKRGSTTIKTMLGGMTALTKVNVVDIPHFKESEYTGLVNENIDCVIQGADRYDLVVPENVSVVKDSIVIASKAGVYNISAIAYGRTFTTKLVVSEPTETDTTE